MREEARRLREKFGLYRVYAYGASAGGTLVALLSGQNLVSAAVAKAPVSDLATWEWPTGRYGPEYWTALGADQATRERLSPALEQVDSSSGSIGAAVGYAISELVPLIEHAPAEKPRRDAWLERLFEAHQADEIPFIEQLTDHWGNLCANDETASAWADRLI